MRRFSLIFALISSIFPALTYAIDACGVNVTINRNHAVQTVTCAQCRTFTDFGMFGGSLLSQTSAISIPVENGRGDKAVVSIQRYIPHPTGASISREILRRLGLQINLPDPHRSGITVDIITGYIFGSRWDNRRTLDRALETKCAEIKRQKENQVDPAPQGGFGQSEAAQRGSALGRAAYNRWQQTQNQDHFWAQRGIPPRRCHSVYGGGGTRCYRNTRNFNGY